MEEYLGIVKLFAGNFAPKGWALCNGQLLSIAQNQALFSLLGTVYGGDGRTTFALPNFQSRIPVGAGQSQGLSNYLPGQVAGSQAVTLITSNLPAHVHMGPGKISVSPANATDSVPVKGASIAVPGSLVSRVFTPTLGFATSTPSVDLTTNIMTSATGSNAPVSVMQPYLSMCYIICLQGGFPSRN